MSDRQTRAERRIGAVVLAAGLGTRIRPLNKLLLDIDGQPCVRRVATAALDAGLTPVAVVVGHERQRVEAALADLPVEIRVNADYRQGMGGSIATGITALPAHLAGAFILLGDMPLIRESTLRRMVNALDADVAACVPVADGRRGNPVLWSARHFPALRALTGDRGARDLLDKYRETVREVAVEDDSIIVDIDTADAAADLRARLARAGPEEGDELARLARQTPRIQPDDQRATRLTLDGKLCPDRVEIAVEIADDTVTACAGAARGCLLCRAAAGVLNQTLAGRPIEDIRSAAAYLRGLALGESSVPPAGWESLEHFQRLKDFPRRINCVLLPFEAAAKAVAQAAAACEAKSSASK